MISARSRRTPRLHQPRAVALGLAGELFDQPSQNSNAPIAQLAAEIGRIAAETARGKCETTQKD
jgi:hypothetical protein